MSVLRHQKSDVVSTVGSKFFKNLSAILSLVTVIGGGGGRMGEGRCTRNF